MLTLDPRWLGFKPMLSLAQPAVMRCHCHQLLRICSRLQHLRSMTTSAVPPLFCCPDQHRLPKLGAAARSAGIGCAAPCCAASDRVPGFGSPRMPLPAGFLGLTGGAASAPPITVGALLGQITARAPFALSTRTWVAAGRCLTSPSIWQGTASRVVKA